MGCWKTGAEKSPAIVDGKGETREGRGTLGDVEELDEEAEKTGDPAAGEGDAEELTLETADD